MKEVMIIEPAFVRKFVAGPQIRKGASLLITDWLADTLTTEGAATLIEPVLETRTPVPVKHPSPRRAPQAFGGKG